METEAGKKGFSYVKKGLFGGGFYDRHNTILLTSGLNNPSVIKKLEALAREKPKIVDHKKLWARKY